VQDTGINEKKNLPLTATDIMLELSNAVAFPLKQFTSQLLLGIKYVFRWLKP
jgi:hypothetical protein